MPRKDQHHLDLPEPLRVKILRKWNSLDLQQKDDLLREVHVGACFNRLGCTLQYEPLFCNKTPDWLVRTDDCEFIVEVTRLRDESIIRGENGFITYIDTLRARLRELPHAYHLRLDLDRVINYDFVTPFFDLKSIISEVKQWLSASYPERSRQICDIHFQIIGRSEDGIAVEMNYAYSRQYQPTRLFDKIRDKVLQRSLIPTDLPYILVVFLEFDSGTNMRLVAKEMADPRSKLKALLWHPGRNDRGIQGVVFIEPLANRWQVESWHADASSEELVSWLNEFMNYASSIERVWPSTFLA